MERRRLGRTDLSVTSLCLGTMTWGEQNTEQEAHAQLDRAIGYGLNFIDTAEAYPIPMKERPRDGPSATSETGSNSAKIATIS